jgi:hypothetical protein
MPAATGGDGPVIDRCVRPLRALPDMRVFQPASSDHKS